MGAFRSMVAVLPDDAKPRRRNPASIGFALEVDVLSNPLKAKPGLVEQEATEIAESCVGTELTELYRIPFGGSARRVSEKNSVQFC